MLNDIHDIEVMMREVFEQARKDIIANHEREGQVASGKTRKSIRSEFTVGVTDVTGTMYGRQYFGALETGSAAWTKQYRHPPKKFVDTIERWMKDKNITGMSAYLVARKIMREGTALYRSPEKKDIFSTVLNGMEEQIADRMTAIMETYINESISRL